MDTQQNIKNECQTCKKGFNNVKKLQQHINKLHTINYCLKCREEFVGNQQFNRHKAKCMSTQRDMPCFSIEKLKMQHEDLAKAANKYKENAQEEAKQIINASAFTQIKAHNDIQSTTAKMQNMLLSPCSSHGTPTKAKTFSPKVVIDNWWSSIEGNRQTTDVEKDLRKELTQLREQFRALQHHCPLCNSQCTQKQHDKNVDELLGMKKTIQKAQLKAFRHSQQQFAHFGLEVGAAAISKAVQTETTQRQLTLAEHMKKFNTKYQPQQAIPEEGVKDDILIMTTDDIVQISQREAMIQNTVNNWKAPQVYKRIGGSDMTGIASSALCNPAICYCNGSTTCSYQTTRSQNIDIKCQIQSECDRRRRIFPSGNVGVGLNKETNLTAKRIQMLGKRPQKAAGHTDSQFNHLIKELDFLYRLDKKTSAFMFEHHQSISDDKSIMDSQHINVSDPRTAEINDIITELDGADSMFNDTWKNDEFVRDSVYSRCSLIKRERQFQQTTRKYIYQITFQQAQDQQQIAQLNQTVQELTSALKQQGREINKLKQIGKAFDDLVKLQLKRKGYNMAEFVGQGGFGRVYKVKADQQFECQAIKVSTQSKALLDSEITFLQRDKGELNSKFIVQLNDQFMLGKKWAFSMPYFKHNLLTLMMSAKLNNNQKRHIAWAILRGLSAGHQHSRPHRDLKLQNILMTKQYFPQISDWANDGITWKYLPPEHFYMQKYNHFLADSWAVGIVIFQLLENGRFPFNDGWQTATQAQKKEHFMLNFEKTPNKAKLLIQALLEPNPRERKTVSDIVNHEWFQGISIFDVGTMNFKTLVDYQEEEEKELMKVEQQIEEVVQEKEEIKMIEGKLADAERRLAVARNMPNSPRGTNSLYLQNLTRDELIHHGLMIPGESLSRSETCVKNNCSGCYDCYGYISSKWIEPSYLDYCPKQNIVGKLEKTKTEYEETLLKLRALKTTEDNAQMVVGEERKTSQQQQDATITMQIELLTQEDLDNYVDKQHNSEATVQENQVFENIQALEWSWKREQKSNNGTVRCKKCKIKRKYGRHGSQYVITNGKHTHTH